MNPIPKKKECHCETQSVYDTRITNKNAKCNNCNYNQAHDDLTKWYGERLEGVEEVIDNSPSMIVLKGYLRNSSLDIKELSKEIVTAIRDCLTKE